MNLHELNAVITDAVNMHQIPGACYAYVTKDTVKLGDAGFRQIVPEKLPVAADTIYDMASCTKVISTTTLALQLMEQGCFSLSTPLQTILPDFSHPEVTIEQIMTHTSGICPDDKGYRTCHTKQEMWDFFKNKPLEFTPGTKVLYSDFGYIALGFVIEKFAGPLDQLAARNIFTPLDMKDTGYQPKLHGLAERCAATEVTEARGVIVGECHDGKGYCLNGISGNAGLFSTTEDLSHYVQMILQDGIWHGKRILNSSSVEMLKHSRTNGLNVQRTLGWISNDPNQSDGHHISDSCIYHTGFTGTSVYIDFQRQFGLILLTNRVHPTRDNASIMEIRNRFHDAAFAAYNHAKKAEL